MYYIGIDPGKSGAMAIIDDRGRTMAEAFDEEGYRDNLEGIKEERCVCCLEKVGAMPGQGVTSMFSFGDNFGMIRGLLTAYHIPYQLILPRVWKKEFGLGSNKEDSITVCKRLFPNQTLLPSTRCRKEADGMAEALLMAEYARRHF